MFQAYDFVLNSSTRISQDTDEIYQEVTLGADDTIAQLSTYIYLYGFRNLADSLGPKMEWPSIKVIEGNDDRESIVVNRLDRCFGIQELSRLLGSEDEMAFLNGDFSLMISPYNDVVNRLDRLLEDILIGS